MKNLPLPSSPSLLAYIHTNVDYTTHSHSKGLLTRLTALNCACTRAESPLFSPGHGHNLIRNVKREMPGISINSPSFPKPQDLFSCSNYVAWMLWILKYMKLPHKLLHDLPHELCLIYRLRIRTLGVINQLHFISHSAVLHHFIIASPVVTRLFWRI